MFGSDNMARKKGGDEDSGGSWMDTYGDMVTLLLTFFVLLYAMSTMDISKWQYIASAFSRGSAQTRVTAEANPENDPTAIFMDEVPEADREDLGDLVDFEDFYMYLKEVILTNDLSDSVSVEMSPMGVYMTFRDNVFFEPDQSDLLPEGQFIITIISDGLRQIEELILGVKVFGHTAQSTGSAANEWELSGLRAASVVNFMIDLDAAPSNKFSFAGWGGQRPIADNSTEAGRRQNRRVEIVFIRNDIDFSDPAVIDELMRLEYGRGIITRTDPEGNPLDDYDSDYYTPDAGSTGPSISDTNPEISYAPKPT